MGKYKPWKNYSKTTPQEIHTGLAGNWSDEERAIANSRLNSDKPLQLSKTEIHKRREGQLLHNRFVAEGKGIPLPMPLTKKPLTKKRFGAV